MAGFEDINEQVHRVSAVIGEIAAASEQQSTGINQINIAIQQMKQGTSHVAANTEESAGAAEELNSRAEEMQNRINLFRLSNGAAAIQATPLQRASGISRHADGKPTDPDANSQKAEVPGELRADSF
ncbi:MAG: hypothetical protein JXR49_20665 [Acidobacteria bacterium]|nr:hypothetical protein [Acidobacteriota bacterium]